MTPPQPAQQPQPQTHAHPHAKRLYTGAETIAIIISVLSWFLVAAGFLMLFESGIIGVTLISSGLFTVVLSGIWSILCDLGQRLQAKGII